MSQASTPSETSRTPPQAAISNLLAERSNDLLWYVDLKGKIRSASGAFEQMLGVTPKELENRKSPWSHIVHPEDQSAAIPKLESPSKYLKGSELTFRAVHADGFTTRWISVRFEPHLSKSGKLQGVACIGCDVTRERGLSEQLDRTSRSLEEFGNSIRLDRARMRQLIDHAGQAFFLFEGVAMKIVDHNRQARILTGYSDAELTQMSAHHIIANAEVHDLIALTRSGAATSAEPVQARLLTRGGDVVDIEVQISALEHLGRTGVQCFVRDISDRVHTERKVLRFEEILKGIHDSTIVFNMSGAVTHANSAACSLWGFTQEMWKSKTVGDLFSDDLPIEAKGNTLLLKGGHDNFDGEFAIKRPDGQERITSTSFSIVRNDTGAPIGLVAISRDVTAEKHLQEQMLQVQKMDSIGTLAGGVAHDFNNLLGGILGYAQIIRNQTQPDTKIHTHATSIERSALRASQLTQQLLSFSRKGKYNVRVTTLNDVVQGSLTLLEGSLPKSIVIHTDVDPNPAHIEVDVTQLEQVILNLCINARDAITEGGWISIRTRTRDLDEEFCSERLGLEPGRHAELTVKDSGHGIPADVLPHIFEPFYTTKQLGRGTGLGLSVVYGIVTNHGGHIEVASSPGMGTQFTVYFRTSDKSLSQTVEVTPEAHGGTECVLVVDDEETIRELADDILNSYGYHVLRASDGIEAIEIFRRSSESIDLILLDMQMPTINGLQTYRRLKALKPNIKVILSSGYGMDQDIQAALSEGVLSFIQKPYKIHDLAHAVRETLDSD